MKKKSCIVLLSGGQDSTTCLFWAKEKFERVIAVGFDYGQKHKKELTQAKHICEKIAKVPYIILPCSGLLGSSSLTNHFTDHNHPHHLNPELPASFTPGRNILFLTAAATYGYKYGIKDIVCGVCQTDYSGYYDCRRKFIESIEDSIALGLYGKAYNDTFGKIETNKVVNIHTPLMYLTKAETFRLAKDLNCLDVIIKHTITDYNGNTKMNDWGMGETDNPASVLRAKGWAEAKANGWV